MRTALIVTLACAVSAAFAQSQTALPNLSGRWVDDTGQLVMLVDQTEKTFTFEMLHQGQSGGKTVVQLDDADHASEPGWTMRAAWRGASLVLLSQGRATDDPNRVLQTWTRNGARLTIDMLQYDARGNLLRETKMELVKAD